MVELPSEVDIYCSADTVFDLIVDFAGQERWLTTSSSFQGTHQVSSNPVRLGTTYREPGPFGVRNGVVTELERPTRVTFHQPMTLKFGLGVLDVMVRYTLSSRGGLTHVDWVSSLGIPGRLKPFRAFVADQFRAESARTLAALKA
jgi:hypothetical protein